MLVTILAVSTACSTEPEATARLLEPSAPAVPNTPQDAAVEGDSIRGDSGRGGQGLVDSEELIGLGELGLLPSLLQTFGARIDCDFDDAFSTCQ